MKRKQFLLTFRESIEKGAEITVSSNPNNLDNSSSNVSCALENEYISPSSNKPLQVSTAVGPESQSLLQESFNRSYSDQELDMVANSLNNLLSDLKHDSETTLYPTKDTEECDMPYKEKLRQEDSVYYSSDEENEGNLELVFDPLGSSFTDPRTGKRYILDD